MKILVKAVACLVAFQANAQAETKWPVCKSTIHDPWLSFSLQPPCPDLPIVKEYEECVSREIYRLRRTLKNYPACEHIEADFDRALGIHEEE